MCTYISGLIHPTDLSDIRLADLLSHSGTRRKIGLPTDWGQEWEWDSDGPDFLVVRCLGEHRDTDGEVLTASSYRAAILARWPTRSALEKAIIAGGVVIDSARPEALGQIVIYGNRDFTRAQLTTCIKSTTPERRGEIGRYSAGLTRAQLTTCIKGTTPECRGQIGYGRDDLTEAQLTACIEGTTRGWRGEIGRYRAGLTPAQRAACNR